MPWDDARVLRTYYLASPLFAALDLGMKSPIRAVGLQSPAARIVYYGATFLLGLMMMRWPTVAPWLAMGESAANLTLLMASVLLPIWSLAEPLDPAGVVGLPDRVANLALSGTVLVYAFYVSQARTRGRTRG